MFLCLSTLAYFVFPCSLFSLQVYLIHTVASQEASEAEFWELLYIFIEISDYSFSISVHEQGTLPASQQYFFVTWAILNHSASFHDFPLVCQTPAGP